MVPLVRLLVACLATLSPAALADSGYEPYIDAAELYRMQLLGLANSFQYPDQKLGGGSAMLDVPYGLMGDGGVSDGLVQFEDDAAPAYWPEELMAELAAATESEAPLEQEEEQQEKQPVELDSLKAKEAQVEKEGEQEKKENPLQQEEKEATKHKGAQLRDQEHLEHSALHGYQSVSGGTVNGQMKQSKTDKALPAYCNPPNPCPVGKTAEDNCVENFENSAENNQRLLRQQECPCDTEHMFTCPEGSQTVSSRAQAGPGSSGEGDAASQINKVIAEISGLDKEAVDSLEGTPTFSATNKRFTLVAKKSPHLIRKRSELPDGENPYLEGEKIKVAAKKSPDWTRFEHKPSE